MSGVDHVLAAIDGALEDYAVSPDAMRWTPEPEEAPTRFELTGGPQWMPGAPDYMQPGMVGLLAGMRVVEDPSIPPGEVLIAVDVARYEETLVTARIVLAREERTVHVAPRMTPAERERVLRLFADAYDVPVCLAAGHAWTAWEYRPSSEGRGSYGRRCTRENCSGFEVQSEAMGMPQP